MSETITRDAYVTYMDKAHQTVKLTLIQLQHQHQTQTQFQTQMMMSNMISESSVQIPQMDCVDKTAQQDASGHGQPLMQKAVRRKMPLAGASQNLLQSTPSLMYVLVSVIQDVVSA